VKLSASDSARFCRSPGRERKGALLYGPDAELVALRRAMLVEALAGPEAAAEMRIDAMTAAELRADPARLDAALRARGFFDGPRVVTVIGASDGAVEIVAAALQDAATPASFLLVTADNLTPRSTLRRLFEERRDAVAAPCYDDAPGRLDVAGALAAAGVAQGAEPDAVEALEAAAGDLGAGAFMRLIETVALHASDRPGPVTAADVLACAPLGAAAETDAAVDAALSGDIEAVRRELARLRSQGSTPVETCLAMARRIRLLHDIATLDRGAAAAALDRMKPAARREKAAAHLRRWNAARLERAIHALIETDAALRGGSAGPSAALLERTLMRLAAEGDRPTA
jgi:DNA polymerase-3 subunit delta